MNTTTVIDLSNCDYAEGFAEYAPYTVVAIIQILLAGSSLPLVVYNSIFSYKNKGTIHKNFLIIYMNAFIHFGVHCTAVFVYDTIKQIHHWTYHNPCDLMITNWSCVTYRALCYTSLFGFSLSHVSMSIERGIATFYLKKYEKMGFSVGILLTTLIWSIAILTNLYLFSTYIWGSEQANLGKTVFICVSVGKNIEYNYLHYIMFVIDGSSTIADIVLLKINKNQETKVGFQKPDAQKIKITKQPMPVEYNLSKRYQVNENSSTISTMIPVVVTHSVLFTLYLVSAMVLRMIDLPELYSRVTIFESVFSLNSMYVLVMMIVILRAPIGKKKMENKIFAKTNETTMYFQMFQKQLA